MLTLALPSVAGFEKKGKGTANMAHHFQLSILTKL